MRAKLCTSGPAPRIHAMSKPRNASTEVSRGGAARPESSDLVPRAASRESCRSGVELSGNDGGMGQFWTDRAFEIGAPSPTIMRRNPDLHTTKCDAIAGAQLPVRPEPACITTRDLGASVVGFAQLARDGPPNTDAKPNCDSA